MESINIEKFAAYIDGNLSMDEAQKMSQFAEHNSMLRKMLDASSIVDDTMVGYAETDLQLPMEFADPELELPDIDKVDYFSFLGDSFVNNDESYNDDGNNADENYSQELVSLKNEEIMAKDYRTYGESGENVYDPIFIKQPDDHSCGLRSQQIVLRDFGIDIPFDKLEKYALESGLYSEDGTYTYDIGKILEKAGVGMHQINNGTIYDLTNELAQGHRVIVSVDAHELWYNNSMTGKLMNWFDDVFGSQGGNHALIVAGVEVNPLNPNDTKVILTDSGDGHLRIEYPLNQFMDAWKDSNCFMAATDEAAPYQYDSKTGMEIPSNFAVEHHYNQFVLENGYQLNPDMINVPLDYQPLYTEHLNTIGDLAYEDYVSLHPTLRSDDGLYSLPTNNNHIEETAGSVGVDLYNHLGETAGSVGLGNVHETTGSVGSIQFDEVGDSVEMDESSDTLDSSLSDGIYDDSLNGEW